MTQFSPPKAPKDSNDQSQGKPKVSKLSLNSQTTNFNQNNFNQEKLPEKSPSKPQLKGFQKWFYDLPIGKKQLIALFTSEVISVVGLVGVGAYLLVTSGRNQLVNQVKSESVVTEINYNIKINQMGFGFRGQSENSAIIEAAQTVANGRQLSRSLREQVKEILVNETRAREIEYATLVGTDLRIIVNANEDRTGQIFNPNNLVQTVINNPEQIKTSEIVSGEELGKESPEISSTIGDKDALIRYTLTPVKNRDTKEVIGVLVSGDIVNGKKAIVSTTLDAFGDGYSGVYKLKDNGEFEVATSLLKKDDLSEAESNVTLSDTSILEKAQENPEEIVTDRAILNDKRYTIAAKSLTNNDGEPVAILLRGTPESSLNSLLSESIQTQLGIAIFAIIVDIFLAIYLGKVIAKRIKELTENTQEFGQGNYQVRANIVGEDEIGQLADSFNKMASQLELNKEKILADEEKALLLAEVTATKITKNQDLTLILNKSLEKARKILGADRLVIYRFNQDWSGYIANESVKQGWISALNDKIEDPCIPKELRDEYLNGRVVATENVFEAGFHEDHLALMKRLNIKANLVVPILNQGELYGLLIAHQCSNVRHWKEDESLFLQSLAKTFGISIERLITLKNQNAAIRNNQILKDITVKINEKFQTEEVLNVAVEEIRKALSIDRVLVYLFDTNWEGIVVAESVASNLTETFGEKITDPCFTEDYVEQYKNGKVVAIGDIYNAGLTDCYIEQLESFQVKANLVVPILVQGELIALLIGHQCFETRYWEPEDVVLFTQLGNQIGLAVDRANLLEIQSQFSKEQKIAKEELQRRALELLMEVDPVSSGDLTIRAQVTEDEIGTIADAYNSTIESLRAIVIQVKSAVGKVAESTNLNNNEITILSQEAIRQSEEINVALGVVKQMAESMDLVLSNASQAETVVEKATQSVQAGDQAITQTVEAINEIRSTVMETSEKVKRLGESSQRIATVVNLISRFAAQTHLLALKASIEAARAGEQGKGFAVIADEVRVLAAQSAEATADIETVVTEIEMETKEVLEAMETETHRVAEGSKLVEETRNNLNQITAASLQINQLVEAISSAAFEQSQNSKFVTNAMSNVVSISEETSLSVNKVSGYFQDLLGVAEELQENVAKFKIN